MTIGTLILGYLSIDAHLRSQLRIKDNSMSPYFKPAGFMDSDRVSYLKFTNLNENLNGCIVAIKNPYKPGEVILRRLVASENDWIQRMDDGGIIKIPINHMWVESINPNDRGPDSLSEFGPLSRGFLIGKAKRVVWPLWRFEKVNDLEKFSKLTNYKYQHSRVFSNQEIFNLYGIR
ncbi:mitochondrial inner membrane protease subunit 2 [Stylonychia lemnae]|uniref:Mitochondrial inner membrane protease subunit 2 n=1 Tax=Stylonychia lemnae TaxID=5949 RepID=A0A078AVH5_STYLE|nr:mitochondrial inner membrane protease subunit 2 [Stylonychia lemnae]|eukprot:CDW86061.1 mitochondrial inner membrane protease subunit 2 [Stylonychia lemnae]